MTALTPEHFTTARMRVLADFADPASSDEWQQHATSMRAALRAAADTIELLMQQRDALADVAGIEPEWTEDDA